LIISKLTECLSSIFEDDSLFGFAPIDTALSEKENCKCALVTLLPYPDLIYNYNAFEYYTMLEELRTIHTKKLERVRSFLDENNINYAVPPASPKDDGEYFADFSYKWAAIHAGLGFIGKNSVFVHYKYAQRVRISCILIDLDISIPVKDIKGECGDCVLCVQACPYNYITGRTWDMTVRREELVDYKKCATKTKHMGMGEGKVYACSYCALACKYPLI